MGNNPKGLKNSQTLKTEAGERIMLPSCRLVSDCAGGRGKEKFPSHPEGGSGTPSAGAGEYALSLLQYISKQLQRELTQAHVTEPTAPVVYERVHNILCLSRLSDPDHISGSRQCLQCTATYPIVRVEEDCQFVKGTVGRNGGKHFVEGFIRSHT